MAGFDVDFEIEVLAGCVEDHRYRQAVRRSIGGYNPWTTEAFTSLWAIVEQLGKEDRLTRKIVKKAARKTKDADLAEELARAGKLVFREHPSAPHYALRKLDEWVREKQLVKGMWRATALLDEGDAEQAEQILAALSRSKGGTEHEESGDWHEGFKERQRQRKHEKENPDSRTMVGTGFKTLDGYTNGGLGAKQLGLIGAYTNVGKSIIAENFTYCSALSGRNTMYVSTEMSKGLVDTRIDARALRFDIDAFNSYAFSKADLREIKEKHRRLKKRLRNRLWVISIPQDTLTRQMLDGWLDEAENRGHPIECLIVDSGDHMTTVPREPDIRIRHAQVFSDLKRIGDERKIPVWSTTNATAPGSGKKRPLNMNEFEACGESKNKARDASVVITLNQTPAEYDEGVMRLFLPKNRNGVRYKTVWLATNFAQATAMETDPPPGWSDVADKG